VLGMISGAVAGLGTITPASGYVMPMQGIAIGIIAGGVFAVGALSVTPEMPNGVQGLLEGNPQQVVMQAYGIAVTLLWSGVMTFIILKVIGALVALRVRNEDEVMGLDVSMHGEALQ